MAFTSSEQAAPPPTLRHDTEQTNPLAGWQFITNETDDFQIAIPNQWQEWNLENKKIYYSPVHEQ